MHSHQFLNFTSIKRSIGKLMNFPLVFNLIFQKLFNFIHTIIEHYLKLLFFILNYMLRFAFHMLGFQTLLWGCHLGFNWGFIHTLLPVTFMSVNHRLLYIHIFQNFIFLFQFKQSVDLTVFAFIFFEAKFVLNIPFTILDRLVVSFFILSPDLMVRVTDFCIIVSLFIFMIDRIIGSIGSLMMAVLICWPFVGFEWLWEFISFKGLDFTILSCSHKIQFLFVRVMILFIFYFWWFW